MSFFLPQNIPPRALNSVSYQLLFAKLHEERWRWIRAGKAHLVLCGLAWLDSAYSDNPADMDHRAFVGPWLGALGREVITLPEGLDLSSLGPSSWLS